MNDLLFALVLVVTALLSAVAVVVALRVSRRRPPEGCALVVSRVGARDGRTRVVRDRPITTSLLQQVEVIDLRPQSIELDRRGREGLVFSDGYRTDFRARLRVRIADDDESIALVARSLGCEGASDPETLRRIFAPKLAYAVYSVAGLTSSHAAGQLVENPQDIIDTLTQGLHGFEVISLELSTGRDFAAHRMGPFR